MWVADLVAAMTEERNRSATRLEDHHIEFRLYLQWIFARQSGISIPHPNIVVPSNNASISIFLSYGGQG